jgi:hypothetical protein
MQSTQHYIDNERNFIANISQNQPTEVIEFKTAILPVVEQVEIDTDIEKEIAQLQEAKINEGIKKVVPVDFDAELGNFFSSIAEEKNQLKEKVKKEVVKIDALEDLFKELSSVKKKKVVKKKEKVLLVEPEKIEEPVVEEVIVEKTPAELTTIERVSKQLSEMQVATELDKDKLRGLESIDSLEKLKKEFLNFKDIVAVQMGTIGGGGSVRILDNEDVDISSIGNGKILEYNSTTEKMQFVTSGDSVTNLEVLGSITFEGSTADDFETTFNVVDPTADRTITLPNISGTLPVLAVASTTQITATPEELNYSDGVTSNIQTQLDAKSTKAFAIAQAVALG